MRRSLIHLLFVVIYFSYPLNAQVDTVKYSFFTAGHTYGHPTAQNYGLHPPFVNIFPKINAYSKMEFGVLLGDVVRDTTTLNWNAVINDIKKINMPVLIAAGNHDICMEFTQRFGPYYYSFINHNDLFIILTPSLGKWNIRGDQKNFLFSTIDSLADKVNNIFVMHHELIWWSPYNILNNIIINYIPDYPGETNFWTEIEPVFNNLPNKVFFFAGDLGATTQVSPFMYYSYDNITMLGTGMGGGVNDNFIITDVYNDTLIFNLFAVNYDDPTELGELTDYSFFNSIIEEPVTFDVSVYPNPVIDYLVVKNNITTEILIQVFDSYGKLLLFLNSQKNINTINFNNWSYGIYLVKITSRKENKTFKILKIQI